MSYVVYLKTYEANEISIHRGLSVSKFTVQTLEISNGLLKKGDYYIPVEHILFIEEV